MIIPITEVPPAVVGLSLPLLGPMVTYAETPLAPLARTMPLPLQFTATVIPSSPPVSVMSATTAPPPVLGLSLTRRGAITHHANVFPLPPTWVTEPGPPPWAPAVAVVQTGLAAYTPELLVLLYPRRLFLPQWSENVLHLSVHVQHHLVLPPRLLTAVMGLPLSRRRGEAAMQTAQSARRIT